MGSCLSSDGAGAGGGSNRNGAGTSPTSPLLSPGSKKVRRGGSGRRKQGAGGGPPFEWEVQQQLHKIQGRMFVNGASPVASLFTQQGKKGTNQDAMIVWENFGSRTDTVFCGVFDGHGPYGHMVARKVRDSLPLKLSTHWEVNIGDHDHASENHISTSGGLSSEEAVSVCPDNESRSSVDIEEESYPEIFTTLKESFLKAFKVMDKELRLHPTIDCFCSGTTAVTLIKQGQDLVIGNVGDSRAVLGTRDQNDCLIAVQLTVDLKPNLPEEEERIKRCRGRVFALRDEPEVSRVWLPHNDSPGLAMARAFGDFCLKDFGLISVPEVSYRRLTEKDEFIVLATDGVWDVLSNKQVVDIVASAHSRSSAARSLVESAVGAWKYKYPTSKIDDCAVVCLFLGNNPNGEADAPVDSISNKQVGSSLYAAGVAGSNDSNMQHELSSQVTAPDRSGSQQSEILREGKGKCKGREGEFVKEQVSDGSGSHHRAPSFDGNTTSPVDGDEWSALEGVARVNTLLTLPRFNVAEETRSTGSKSKKIV